MHLHTERLQMYVLTKETQVNGAHNNTYPTDCSTSGTAGGPLKCFTTSLKDGKLTVIKS